MPKSGPAAVEVSVVARDFVDLAQRTKAFDKKLGTTLRRNLRRAGDIGAQAAKDAALGIPSSGAAGVRHAGLRRASGQHWNHNLRVGIAAGIGVQVATSATSKRVGVFIVGSGKGLPADQRVMVRKMNRDTFKHPVFGNRGTWASQTGHPYFDVAIKKTTPQVQALVEQAMSEALTAITGA